MLNLLNSIHSQTLILNQQLNKNSQLHVINKNELSNSLRNRVTRARRKGKTRELFSNIPKKNKRFKNMYQNIATPNLYKKISYQNNDIWNRENLNTDKL